MSLPKGTETKHVWIGMIGVFWALTYGVFVPWEVYAEGEWDGPGAVWFFSFTILLGFAPITVFAIWLRRRISFASKPFGVEKLRIKKLEREIATIKRGEQSEGVFVDIIAGLGFLFAIGVLGYQGYEYLRYDRWISMSWNDLDWFVPTTDWVGLQKTLNWVADQHAGLIVAIAAVIFLMVAGSLGGLGGSERPTSVQREEVESLKRKIAEETAAPSMQEVASMQDERT